MMNAMQNEVTLTYAQHAAQARSAARAIGLHDCIHYAPDATSRADALYALANESGLDWWANKGGNPFLLADGRMVVVCDLAWFFEPLPGGASQ